MVKGCEEVGTNDGVAVAAPAMDGAGVPWLLILLVDSCIARPHEKKVIAGRQHEAIATWRHAL